MKCPLRTKVEGVKEHIEEYSFGDCIKADCTWWLDDVSLCAIKDLALELRYTQLRLADMSDKMPKRKEED